MKKQLEAFVLFGCLVGALIILCSGAAFGQMEVVFTGPTIELKWQPNPEPDVKDYGLSYRLFGESAWISLFRTAEIYASVDAPGAGIPDRYVEFALDVDDLSGNRSDISEPSVLFWPDSGEKPSTPDPPVAAGDGVTVTVNTTVVVR